MQRAGQRERHECRPGVENGVAKLPCQLITEVRCAHLRDGQATGGDDQRVGLKITRVGRHFEAVVETDSTDVAVRHDPDARAIALALQHRHDLFRRTVAKQLPEGFFVVGDAVLLDQRNKVPLRVATQRRYAKRRVRGDKARRLTIEVGEIAAAATGHEYLLADPVRAFEHNDRAAAIGRGYCAQETGGAAADNDDVGFHPAARIAGLRFLGL